MKHYEPPDPEELEEIQELNLLFLIYLRSAAREGRSCLGLPVNLAAKLRNLSSAALEAVAVFPRSLFILDLDNLAEAREHPLLSSTPLEQSRQALYLTILHSAWNMCRQREFQARMFLRLSVVTGRRLRTMPLSELLLLSVAPNLLACASPGAEPLWETLLDRSQTDMSRALRLIALHPDAEHNPARRVFALHSM